MVNWKKREVVDTTVGRALIYEIVPKGLPYNLVNRPLGNKDISRLINICYRTVGLKDTVIFADQMMYMGYEYSTAQVRLSVLKTSSFRMRKPDH